MRLGNAYILNTLPTLSRFPGASGAALQPSLGSDRNGLCVDYSRTLSAEDAHGGPLDFKHTVRGPASKRLSLRLRTVKRASTRSR